VGFIHRNILNNRHVPVCYGESTRNIIENTTSGAKANLMMTITQYVYRWPLQTLPILMLNFII